ncbi:MAG: hypothetical protein JWO31_3119 [Phycisphaerales bacterium]|nr:hypothetical protein [Phycisphaerales bacterium]
MATTPAQQFIAALKQAEESKSPDPLVAVFAPDAELDNPSRSVVRKGTGGAGEFWKDYLSAFDGIRSEFTHVIESKDAATLEWKSQGTLAHGGGPVTYRGVSVVEFAGDKVKRFATYYDSATFVPGGSKQGGGK